MNKKPFVITLAVLAIVGSVTWIYLNRPGRPPQVQLTPYRARGEVAGAETARLLNHKGRVVIIARDDSEGANPVADVELKAFRAALKQGGAGIAAIERFRVPLAQVFSGGGVPRERFLQVLQAHPKTDALVLFAEFPALDQADRDLLKQSGVKIVLISGNRPACQGLLEAGLVHLAIVPRTDSPIGTSKPPQSSREHFDRYYVVLAPGKMPGLP